MKNKTGFRDSVRRRKRKKKVFVDFSCVRNKHRIFFEPKQFYFWAISSQEPMSQANFNIVCYAELN